MTQSVEIPDTSLVVVVVVVVVLVVIVVSASAESPRSAYLLASLFLQPAKQHFLLVTLRPWPGRRWCDYPVSGPTIPQRRRCSFKEHL
jgi:hypothetical protein